MACCQDKECSCGGSSSSFVFGLIIGAFLAAAVIILTSKDKDKIIKNIRNKIDDLFKDKIPEIKKNLPEIMVAHNIPYVATATHSYPIDFMNKVKKAREIKGPTYIHCLSVCPTGWRAASELCIEIGRLAVETGVFPLYEVENGKYKLTEIPDSLRPVEDYLKVQGRFRHLTPDQIKIIQDRVNLEYQKLMNKVEHSPP